MRKPEFKRAESGLWLPTRRQAIATGLALAFPVISHGAIAAVAGAHTSGFANGITTPAICTFSCNLIVIYVAGDTDFIPSDSKGNTYTRLGIASDTSLSPAASQLSYCLNPTVSAATVVDHTFTAGSGFPVILMAGFSGVRSNSALAANTKTGNHLATTTIQPGSITPTMGDLLISGVGYFETAQSASVNSGFTITDQLPSFSGVCYGGALAYLIAPNASPVNPTWTIPPSATAGMASSMADFLPPGGAAGRRKIIVTGG